MNTGGVAVKVANGRPFRWTTVFVLGIVTCTPVLTSGQTIDPQRALAAQALYEQATAEMDANKYASACPRLEEVTRLVPEGVGARLTLARCYEAIDKLASAWSQYALAQGLAVKVGQEQRAQDAAQKAAELKPKLATMKIEVAEATRKIPELIVIRDGVPVGAPQWGMALPVDVGPHEVVATAPGYVTRKKSFEVVANGVEVTVNVPVLELDRNAPLPPRAIAAPVTTVIDRSWQRPIGMATTAAGAIGVGTGLILGSIALSKNAQSKENNHCDANNRCDATGLSLRQEALSLGYGSTATLLVGVALLAGGGVLLLTAPSEKKQTRPKTGLSLGWGNVAWTGEW